ncbi:MAG: FtsX-like permease family protein [Bacteroidales bacterium]|nr:FtsX-like permease family protein [Bacteroidales bacterium]
MIIQTAWRNVWRNKLRSLVVIASVTIGIFGGVFAVAVMNGAIEQRVDAALNNELGHVQITQPDFRQNFDIHLTLDSILALNQTLLSIDGVTAVTNRTIVSAMANTASKSAGVMLIGIDPEADKQVFDLYENLLPNTGSFFKEKHRNNLVYIGEDLARELNMIRYRIENATLDSLKAQGVPEETIAKLEQFRGRRFTNRDSFTDAMQQVLTKKEADTYGRTISNAAWTFRKWSKLTLTFLDKNNMQTGGVFRVGGIYDINNKMYEMSYLFATNADIKKITGIEPGKCHMTVLRINSLDDTKRIVKMIREQFPDLEVRSWKEITPEMAMMTDLVEQFYVVFMLIILAALAFGIVNTMLMVVLERTKELGMLTAIGMNKKRVFRMIMTESVFLSLIGGIAGMIVSWILVSFTSANGINFVNYGEGFEAMGFSAHIYPDINFSFFIIVTLLIVITGILSAVYPALKALKLDPAEALRTE